MARFGFGSITLAAALAVAASLPSVARADVYASLTSDLATVLPGDTVTVHVGIFQADSSFNGFDAYISFDPARLELQGASLSAGLGTVVTAACNNVFGGFVAHAAQAEIHVGFLCPATFVRGPGEIYKIRFRVLAPSGPTDLTWAAGSEFFNAGFFVRPLHALPLTLVVRNPTDAVGPRGTPAGLSFETPRPNPYRGGGPVTLKFALPDSAPVGFTIFDAQGRRVASRAPADFGAGAHSLVWTGLRLSPGLYQVNMQSGSDFQIARAWAVVR